MKRNIVKVGADGSIPDPPRSLGPPDDPHCGKCPTCAGETSNGSEDIDDVDFDEDGRKYVSNTWSWTNCDTCLAKCKECGSRDVEKIDSTGLCEYCHEEQEKLHRFKVGDVVICTETSGYILGQVPEDQIGEGEELVVEEIQPDGLQFEEHANRYGPFPFENFRLKDK